MYIPSRAIGSCNLFDFSLWGLFKLLELNLLCQKITNGETKIEMTEALGNVEVELVARHFVTVGHTYLCSTSSHTTSYANQEFANHIVENGSRPSLRPLCLVGDLVAVEEKTNIDQIR